MNMQPLTGMETTLSRAQWMGILARVKRQDIEEIWNEYTKPCAFEWLRKPHTGLVMVQGRTGGTGNAFNLGEMTVTRCALQMQNEIIGHGYVQGRDKLHAELAAKLDAFLQNDELCQQLIQQVIIPLSERLEQQRIERSRKAASTKVDFFTLVRGENPS